MVNPKSNTSSKRAPAGKIVSPARKYRKKNAFSEENMKKGSLSKPSGTIIEVITTLGDEELYLIIKGGANHDVDAYSLHLKQDIEDCLPIKSELCLVGGFPRRVSKEAHVVALSSGEFSVLPK
jgi:hypothetical protein